MVGQRNQAMFVFFVTLVLYDVSFVFSLPREYNGLIPRRVLTRERFPWKPERSYSEVLTGEGFPWKPKRYLGYNEGCKDQRMDCREVIRHDNPSYWCTVYKGQCDGYCGECSAACKDVEPAFECYKARMYGDKCRERKYKDGCELTCCNCDKLFNPNCN